MLKVCNLTAGYGGADVIKGVSFEMAQGKTLAIIGPNGCGKTTLLRAIAGLIKYSGEICVGGINIAGMKPRQMAGKLAMLGQLQEISFGYSVYDTVMMGRYHHISGFLSSPSEADKKIVEMCLHTLSLDNISEKMINTLSGGQLQRVFLARTMAQNPDVILLDEPTNHLDLKHQFSLIDHLKNWAATENKTIIGVLHDINLARYLTDDIMLMNDGRIAAAGCVDDVLNSAVLQEVYEMDIPKTMQNLLSAWQVQ